MFSVWYGRQRYMGCLGVARERHPAWAVLLAELDSNSCLVLYHDCIVPWASGTYFQCRVKLEACYHF